MDITTYIADLIKNNDVVIFMKGSANLPACGFSATVVTIFKRLNIPFHGEDILQNEDLRAAIKTYSNWPTLPQIYIKGEFIGGCDIVKDMFLSGELETLLKDRAVSCNT
jgi:monothiol glutaredoxin